MLFLCNEGGSEADQNTEVWILKHSSGNQYFYILSQLTSNMHGLGHLQLCNAVYPLGLTVQS